MRIQYKCLVPIYVFPEMKLCILGISKTELYCSVSQFLHSYICDRFIYFQDQSVYFAAAKYICGPILGIYKSLTVHMNVGIGTEAVQFLFREYINGLSVQCLTTGSLPSSWRLVNDLGCLLLFAYRTAGCFPPPPPQA